MRLYFVLGLEQAAISAPNMLYILVLARLLPADQFSLVALGYSVYLVLISFYEALFVDPMVVIARGADADPSRYYGSVWLLTLIATGVAFAGSLTIWTESGRIALQYLSVAMMTVFLRRSIHSAERSALSFLASLAYGSLLLSALAALYLLRLVAVSTAVLPFAVGNICFIMVILFLGSRPRVAQPNPQTILPHLWLGLSSVVSTLSANLTINIYPLFFAMIGGNSSVAEFRLILAVLSPFFHSAGAIYGYVLPRLVGARFTSVDPTLKMVLMVIILAPGVCALLAIGGGSVAAGVLFGARYAHLGSILPVALGAAMLSLCAYIASMWLRAKRLEAQLRLLGLLQFAVTAVAGLPLAWSLGTVGAFLGYGAAQVTAMAFLLYLFQKR
jgi:hypothetical protein